MLIMTPTKDIAKNFFVEISSLPNATLEQIYFAIAAELQEREIMEKEENVLSETL